jgi:CRISPR-associated protein Cmx8
MTFDEMNEKDRLKHLSVIIRRLIDRYVEGRAEVKTGKKAKTFPKKPIPGKGDRLYTVYPSDFREAQQRVCSDAFLSMRSRHDQDFIDFFASSVCSVAQFLPPDQYEFLIQTLMTKPDADPLARKVLSWEDVKAVAMIAVSACSYRVRPRETQDEGRKS